MNAFELTMMLAKFNSNPTKAAACRIKVHINMLYYQNVLFPMSIEAMKLMVNMLDICDYASKKSSWAFINVKHRLHKELQDAVLDSSTGLKAQRAT